jgi:hypothetical protein
MEIKYFHQWPEFEMVDAWVLPDGEQRVTLKRRYAGTMVLRQGVLANHIWVYWSHKSDKKSEQSTDRYDIDHWNQFFNVANGAMGPRSPSEIVITHPKRSFLCGSCSIFFWNFTRVVHEKNLHDRSTSIFTLVGHGKKVYGRKLAVFFFLDASHAL